MTDDVTERVYLIVKAHLPAEISAKGFDSDAELQMFGLDSLAVAGVVIGLEEAFGLTLPSERITRESFWSVRTICDTVQDLLGSAHLSNPE